MDLTERTIGNATVLDVRGRLYGLEAGCRLERAVERLGRAGRRAVVANLEDVSAVDAGGLGALVAAYRASVRSRVTFKLARATRRTRHLIVATRLSRVLKTFNSVEDALDEEPEPVPMLQVAPRGWARTLARWPPAAH